MSVLAERCLMGGGLPGRLADLDTPPERLFVRGELPRGPAVAVVGTRSPSPAAAQFTLELASELARSGVAVLSGGAAGIDTQAHRGALDGGGQTVVVAPSGFERPFPKENAGLFREVVQRGGAYVSLVDAQSVATQTAFFPRNACLVALAHVVLVVEAPIRSGARNAAAHARRLGRPLFVVPAAPWHPQGRGCLAELRLGARPLITVKDLLRALAEQNLHPIANLCGPAVAAPSAQQSLTFTETSPAADARQAVLAALLGGAGSCDEICVQSCLPASRVSELVLTLRLEGVLVTDPSGRLQIHNQLI